MQHTILVIDDDEKLTALLTDFLESFQYKVVAAHKPSDGYKLLKDISPDLIVLDVMLPEENGLDVCKNIRQQSDIPILMLTAKGEVTDRIIGLEIGSDDYLAKPFEPRELLARIRALLRRGTSKKVSETSKLGMNVEILWKQEQVTMNERNLQFTHGEFELFKLLAENTPNVVTRDEIMNTLRGIDFEAYNRAIDVMISRIRQKLGESARMVKTIRGSGYKLITG